jgi:uncharacterized radical SAM superfamily Fe-S cluster-containing enzyme
MPETTQLPILKTTISLCPHCLTKVPATVIERDGRVYLNKVCPTHGEEEALLASDAKLYWNADASDAAACGVGGCCADNHSCTLIFEITEKCNLTCPTCFAGSSPQHSWMMSVEEFTEKLDRLLGNGKNDADMVQISGGEPTIHPDLERMVEICFERRMSKIYINTNGIKLATDPDLAKRLAAIDAGRDRLQFYLQFDGFQDSTYAQIRGAKGLMPLKRKAMDNATQAGLYVLPVMTVTRGINLHEIGEVFQMVQDYHPRMNTLMLQPAFYSGRYENDQSDRLTLAEVAHEVVEQTGLFSIEDFGPIPCSHPNCFAMAVGLVHDGKIIPVSRYFPSFDSWQEPDVSEMIARLSDRMPQRMIEDLAEEEMIESLLDLLTGGGENKDWSQYENFVAIGIKPFMDAHTYDQDRIDRCCVHVVDRAGEPVSLCEYNAVHRPQGCP